MNIGLDIDGILTDTHAHVVKAVKEKYGKTVEFRGDSILTDLYEWYPEDSLPADDKIKRYILKNCFGNPAFMEQLEIRKEIRFFLKELEVIGNIFVITARGKNMAGVCHDLIGKRPFTLVMGKDKGTLCKDWDIGIYVEDRWPEALNITQKSPNTKVILPRMQHNEKYIEPVKGITIARDIVHAFDLLVTAAAFHKQLEREARYGTEKES